MNGQNSYYLGQHSQRPHDQRQPHEQQHSTARHPPQPDPLPEYHPEPGSDSFRVSPQAFGPDDDPLADLSAAAVLERDESEDPRDDQPADADKDRGTPASGPKKGGRPRDKVWEFFDGDRVLATCRFCDWRSDHPKVFRMRAHVQACDKIPNDKKVEHIELEQERNRLKLFKRELAAETHATVSAEVIAAVQANADKKKRKSEAASGPSPSADDGPVAGPSGAQPPAPKRPKPQESTYAPTTEAASSPILGKHFPMARVLEAAPPAPPAPPVQPARCPITCHVLDSTSGKPAAEMRVRLDRLTTSGFILQGQGSTDRDGRCATLLPIETELEVGIFKITFFTSEYFTSRGILSFYPFVEIPFEVKSPDEHYHIPCLLSPYSYTTYRGS
ncbi:hypothetical protein JCM10212_005383 [Sporobolomyces blumeae]